MMLFVSLWLFFGMLVATEVGRRMGMRQLAAETESAQAWSGLLDGAIFGLMGLLIAFTFSGAASRFDHRRDLVMDEANAIGTAYLRLDLLPAETQPALRGLFRQYLDARLDVYRKLPDREATEAALVRANGLQGHIWSTAVKACQESGSVAATTLLLAEVNEMFDVASVRTATARVMHPPTVIFVMLVGLSLLSSVLAGYALAGKGERGRTHVLAFAVVISLTVYVILDIEYPRFGLIRGGPVDQMLVEVRKSMDWVGESQASQRKD